MRTALGIVTRSIMALPAVEVNTWPCDKTFTLIIGAAEHMRQTKVAPMSYRTSNLLGISIEDIERLIEDSA